MADKHKRFGRRPTTYLVLTINCFLWFGSAILSVDVCHASKIEVGMEANGVKIAAHKAPLIDILNKLSRQAAFRIVSDVPLDEVVTQNINAASVEDCIRQLISDKSYAMYYEKLSDGSVALTEIIVFENSLPTSSTPSTGMQNQPDDQHHFKIAAYEKAFSDTAALSKQLHVKKLEQPVSEHPPGRGGIQVTDVAPDSIFSRIGIAKGDILLDVNGIEITGSQAFLSALQKTPGSPPIIRIERFTKSGQIAPIYIHIELN